jgi:hypothetical protein
MALGSDQPQMEPSTKNVSGLKGRPTHFADINAICEQAVYKMWKLRCLTNLWASTVWYRDSFIFLYVNDVLTTYEVPIVLHGLLRR